MSFRMIASIATSVVVASASIAIVSTEAFARTPSGTTRLHHHHHHGAVHHSGQVRVPKGSPASAPAASKPQG